MLRIECSVQCTWWSRRYLGCHRPLCGFLWSSGTHPPLVFPTDQLQIQHHEGVEHRNQPERHESGDREAADLRIAKWLPKRAAVRSERKERNHTNTSFGCPCSGWLLPYSSATRRVMDSTCRAAALVALAGVSSGSQHVDVRKVLKVLGKELRLQRGEHAAARYQQNKRCCQAQLPVLNGLLCSSEIPASEPTLPSFFDWCFDLALQEKRTDKRQKGHGDQQR